MNFLFVCGGTAGHINPALAIAAELRHTVPYAKILFAGAGKTLEKKLIPHAGYHLVNIKMSGLKRTLTAENLLFNINTLRNLAVAGVKAEQLLKRYKPCAVIGTGGYICYPILKKAAQMGIPTLVHESNAVPGLTTKLLSASVDKVLVSFPGLENKYRRPKHVIFTGTPVREGFISHNGHTADMKTGSKPLIVSFWGSLGAEYMNEITADFIRLNISSGLFDHIHAAGKGGVDIIKNRLNRSGILSELPEGIEIREYIDDMQSVMGKADIVMCRAGGSTIAEVTYMGKPAVLIPSPYVTDNQQFENARQVEKSGGAVLIQEKDCSGDALFAAISTLLANKERLAAMSKAQKEIGVPDAAHRIVKIIMELL